MLNLHASGEIKQRETKGQRGRNFVCVCVCVCVCARARS